ncbi:MAG: AbrB/MazE/SpoVT family DNA-binding domain-containing protein [Candidatus Sericytochromatia bacterium]|nr:AbrB/MazE/SpoVT family DNA-binding domain-containing protein [Candidatus Tanganyikabacteria bacterium]
MKRAHKATVSSKGQVTIPGALRRRLGIDTGTILEFREEPGRLVVTKVEAIDPIDALTGIIDLDGMTTDEFLDEIRGPAAQQ